MASGIRIRARQTAACKAGSHRGWRDQSGMERQESGRLKHRSMADAREVQADKKQARGHKTVVIADLFNHKRYVVDPVGIPK
jgi:hypothetical protein